MTIQTGQGAFQSIWAELRGVSFSQGWLDAGGIRTRYLTSGYLPDPHTILDGVFKLPAGHSLTVSGGKVRTTRYWNLPFAAGTVALVTFQIFTPVTGSLYEKPAGLPGTLSALYAVGLGA